MSEDLLLEIGVEELPATFVAQAVEALPGLLESRLRELRLSHGPVRALGTPRRLALIVQGVASAQPDLDEEALGRPRASPSTLTASRPRPPKASPRRSASRWKRCSKKPRTR